MDLLAPWKMCLQCLPVFSPQPLLPPPSSAVPLRAASSATSTLNKGASTAENDFQEAEKPSFSDASLAPDHQHQDLPLSDYAKEVGSLDYADPPLETNVAANGDAKKLADHDFNSVVAAQAPQDDDDESTPPPSPVTHAPIGLGSILGHHRPLHHIHHQVHSAIPSHGHDKPPPPPLHPSSDSTSHEGRADPPVSSSQSEDEGGDKETAHSHPDDAPSHPQSIPSHVQGLQTPIPPLETFYSTPADNGLAESTPHGAYEDENTAMLGSSSTLETSRTEPVDGVRTPLMRRREQFKHQFKDLRNQLKQGGQQLRKEGTKHLQKMMSARNKQGQPNQKSGSFSTVPRSPHRD